jgi:hypothetical protein
MQHFILRYRSTSHNLPFVQQKQPVKNNTQMKTHTRTNSEREAAQDRDEARRQEYVRFAPLSAEIAAIYDARRLTEADVDHLAELDTESRTYNRTDRSSHE